MITKPAQSPITANEASKKTLSRSFVAVEDNGLWGVCNNDGRAITDTIYDMITKVKDMIIVCKDGKIGVIDSHGNYRIKPYYSMIECGVLGTGTNDHYNENFVFDSWTCNRVQKRIIIRSVKEYPFIKVELRSSFHWDSVLILSTNKYSELFTMEHGILPDSRGNVIVQLNDHFFAIKKGDNWGIYHSKKQTLTINCNYNWMRYGGGNSVILSSAHLLGVLSLSGQTLIDFHPFLEIKSLDSTQLYFGVKEWHWNRHEREWEDYCIYYVGGSKQDIEISGSTSDFQFEWFSKSRILTKRGEKWGFIGISGDTAYTSIPFKYDYIERRKDGHFDVMINSRWGVLSLDGKEIVLAKYKERVPTPFDGAVVWDKDSGCCGILSKTGGEKIPTMYYQLKVIHRPRSCILCSVDKYDGWGCLDSQGNMVVPPLYNSIIVHRNRIVAKTFMRNDLYDFKGDILSGVSSDPPPLELIS